MYATSIDYAAASAGLLRRWRPDRWIGAGKQQSVDRQCHTRRLIEFRVGDAAGDETDSGIETHGMRVGGHFQSLDTARSDDLGDAIHQRSCQSPPRPCLLYTSDAADE